MACRVDPARSMDHKTDHVTIRIASIKMHMIRKRMVWAVLVGGGVSMNGVGI